MILIFIKSDNTRRSQPCSWEIPQEVNVHIVMNNMERSAADWSDFKQMDIVLLLSGQSC